MPLCEITGEVVATLDEHHVIPREYGGEDSLTVRISPTLHASIHRAVNKPREKERILSLYSREISNKIECLINSIELAKTQLPKVEKRQVTLTFSQEEWDKIKNLSLDLGSSPATIVSQLIKNLLNNTR